VFEKSVAKVGLRDRTASVTLPSSKSLDGFSYIRVGKTSAGTCICVENMAMVEWKPKARSTEAVAEADKRPRQVYSSTRSSLDKPPALR
jgi:hypothetical protein